jgi:hypothetical protein
MPLDVAIGVPSPDCAATDRADPAFPGGPGATAPAAKPAVATDGIEEKHSFELARDAGYFERVGADTEVSSMIGDWVDA